MDYLIYVSTAKKLMAENDLLDILTVSRGKNDLNQVTGILLYSGGSFMQCFEGSSD